MRRILILGGTTESRQLAGLLADRTDLAVTLSLAGRTRAPVRQPVPVRTGGFGGVEGLVAYLETGGIDLLIDATHPYAAIMSAHAAAAAERSGVAFLALRRPAWERVADDRWMDAADVPAAIAALGEASRRVFLALGRQEVMPFAQAPQHHYLVRSIEPIDPPLAVPQADYLLQRGPFPEADERRLLAERGIEAIVAKNSGGAASYGKIAAARALGLTVVMLRRPALPDAPTVPDAAAALAWIDHRAAPARRGL